MENSCAKRTNANATGKCRKTSQCWPLRVPSASASNPAHAHPNSKTEYGSSTRPTRKTTVSGAKVKPTYAGSVSSLICTRYTCHINTNRIVLTMLCCCVLIVTSWLTSVTKSNAGKLQRDKMNRCISSIVKLLLKIIWSRSRHTYQ